MSNERCFACVVPEDAQLNCYGARMSVPIRHSPLAGAFPHVRAHGSIVCFRFVRSDAVVVFHHDLLSFVIEDTAFVGRAYIISITNGE